MPTILEEQRFSQMIPKFSISKIANFSDDIGTISPLLVDSGLEIKHSYTNDQIWK